jgi:hypothetical protein
MDKMFDLGAYSETVHAILSSLEDGRRRMPLAPDGPERGEGLELLRATPTDSLFEGDTPASTPFAECVRSALFLYYSALDESHTISQDIETGSGSFLHGIMHRQEPDYSNAKYWFRRVGEHELFPTLREDALRLSLKTEETKRAIQENKRWDAMWFVDFCERAARAGGALEQDAMELQRSEWELLFDYCYRRALAG